MNFKTTLILLLVVIAAGGAYLLTRSSSPAPPEQAQAVSQPLIKGRLYDRLTIHQANQTFVFQNENGDWFQVKPVRFPVNFEAVESVLMATLSLTPFKTLAAHSPDIDAGELGLNPPTTSVTLQGGSGTHTLHLNAYQPGKSAYVMMEKQPSIYMVEPTLHQLVSSLDPENWRPAQLPTASAERVNAITLERDDHVLTLTRNGDGWHLGEKGQERADPQRATQLAAVQPNLKVNRYVADDPDLSTYGLSQPWAILTASSPEGETTLKLGGVANLAGTEIFATWSDQTDAKPVVFSIDRSLVEPVNVDAQDMRDTRLVTSLPGTLRGIRIVRTGQDTLEVSLRPDGKGYAFGDPQPGYAPDTAAVSGLLRSLLETRAIDFVRAPATAQAPLAVIELKLSAGRVERLRIYADRDGREDKWLVVREIEPVAAVVQAEALDVFLSPLIAFRDRSLDAQPYGPSTFGTITLTSPDGTANRLTLANDNWEIKPGLLVAPEAWAALVRWLAEPTVESWINAENLSEDEDVVVLKMDSLGLTYRVDPKTGLASRSDHTGTFQLSDDVTKLWATPFFTE